MHESGISAGKLPGKGVEKMKTFLLGALGYPAIELLWRGRTHPSMAMAGGLSLCILRRLNRQLEDAPLWLVALLGGASITGLEYLIGVTLNRRHRIWDYRKRWMNLQGQICPAFALAWCGLSGIVMGGMRMAKA